MNSLLILATQSKSVATLEILSLLLVAAIIGYITAWLYYRSIFKGRMKAIVSEKDELNHQINQLNTEKSNLHKSLHERNIELEQSVREVNALKALHTDTVHETHERSLKFKSMEPLLYDKDEAMVNIAQRKHLLDYRSFGSATKAEMDDLKMISGIGPFIEERLHALDIYTFRQISKFTDQDIDTINDAIEYFSGRIDRDEWVAQATELVHSYDKRMDLLRRIRERKARIQYNRIGIGKKEEADDLTVISGIGGWIHGKTKCTRNLYISADQ